MPHIEIEQNDYERLQKMAEPFVDTPASVLTRVLDAFMAASDAEAIVEAHEIVSGVEEYDFYDAPPLVHVKLISGRIGSTEPITKTWDGMVRHAVELVLARVDGVSAAKPLLDLNMVEGEKVDDGYKFVPELGISYQGVSAQHAAKVVANAARFLRQEALVEFHWRNKAEAHFPGRFAKLRFKPSDA